MKPSEIPQKMALHDSGVRSVDLVDAKRTIRINIDLCNYMQSSYREGEPDTVQGALVFSDISRFESKPDLRSIAWATDMLEGEILTSKELTEPEEGVELIIHLIDYSTSARDILVLRIFGGNVMWQESPTRAQ